MRPAMDQAFDSVVLEGAFEAFGMADFSDVLTKEDTLAIRAYIAHDRKRIAAGATDEEIHFH